MLVLVVLPAVEAVRTVKYVRKPTDIMKAERIV
jgi:hypothetical protein